MLFLPPALPTQYTCLEFFPQTPFPNIILKRLKTAKGKTLCKNGAAPHCTEPQFRSLAWGPLGFAATRTLQAQLPRWAPQQARHGSPSPKGKVPPLLYPGSPSDPSRSTHPPDSPPAALACSDLSMPRCLAQGFYWSWTGASPLRFIRAPLSATQHFLSPHQPSGGAITSFRERRRRASEFQGPAQGHLTDGAHRSESRYVCFQSLSISHRFPEGRDTSSGPFLTLQCGTGS